MQYEKIELWDYETGDTIKHYGVFSDELQQLELNTGSVVSLDLHREKRGESMELKGLFKVNEKHEILECNTNGVTWKRTIVFLTDLSTGVRLPSRFNNIF